MVWRADRRKESARLKSGTSQRDTSLYLLRVAIPLRLDMPVTESDVRAKALWLAE